MRKKGDVNVSTMKKVLFVNYPDAGLDKVEDKNLIKLAYKELVGKQMSLFAVEPGVAV